MAILDILRYPDPRLHMIAKPVDRVDEAVQQLVVDMAETMYAAPGVGLAAVQVCMPLQIIVIDISETRNDLRTFINPKIRARAGEQEREEGCLSVPGIYDKVKRAERIVVDALDRDGKAFSLEADGLLAVCIQHEIDHLYGKVFVEYLSQLKQVRIRTKLKKAQRKSA